MWLDVGMCLLKSFSLFIIVMISYMSIEQRVSLSMYFMISSSSWIRGYRLSMARGYLTGTFREDSLMANFSYSSMKRLR